MTKKERVDLLISKSHESLEVTRQLFATNHFGICASRAYYSMFYAAQAVLLHIDLQFKKHSAVIATFNKKFVKTGVFSPAMFKSLEKGYDLRIESDYGLVPVTKEEANALIKEAQNFLAAAREYLLKEGYDLTGELGL